MPSDLSPRAGRGDAGERRRLQSRAESIITDLPICSKSAAGFPLSVVGPGRGGAPPLGGIANWLSPQGCRGPSTRLPRFVRNNTVNASHRKRSTGSGPPQETSGARAPRDYGQIGTSLHRAGAMHDVECCDRPAETFQLQVAEVLEPCDRFYGFCDAAADQDLPVLGRRT